MVVAGVLAILTLTHRVQVWHVFVLAAIGGVINAFDIPARQAFLSDMVGREKLMNAIALNSSMFNGARIVGPAVAGILVASIGEGWCFGAEFTQLHRGHHRAADDEADLYAACRGTGQFAAAGHRRGLPFREECEADPHLAAAARTGEPGGNAVLRADADLCRSHPAWRSAWARAS